MKKMKLAVVFAALVSVFGFSSCLNDGDSGPQQYMSLVTIGGYGMGSTVFYPDESPNQALVPNVIDLTKYGIKDGSQRALVTYTIPEGQDLTGKQISISLVAGSCQTWDVNQITNRPDTCVDYTSPFAAFSNYGVDRWVYNSVNIAKDRYLNIGYSYRADKLGNVALVPNRASNDTVYMDFKLKREGTTRTSGVMMNTYDLRSNAELFMEATPLNDSVYVTIVGSVAEYNDTDAKKDSVTARCKSLF